MIKELADCVRESEARAKLNEWLDGDDVKVRTLKRRCTLAGVTKAEIDSAANGQDPKEALIGLLAGDDAGPPWKEGDPPLKDAAAEVRTELEGMKDALRRQTATGHGTSGADKVVAFATALGAAPGSSLSVCIKNTSSGSCHAASRWRLSARTPAKARRTTRFAAPTTSLSRCVAASRL